MIRVLVAEDNEDYITLLEHRFENQLSSREEHVFYLDFARSFAELTEKLDSKNYNCDIVMLDLMLGDTVWTETVDMFTSRYPTIPFCVMSALTSNMYAIKSINKGAQDYFCKSDRRSDFKERVVYAIARDKHNKEMNKINGSI